jgi:MFS family permease
MNGLSFLYAALSAYFVTIPQTSHHQEDRTWKEQCGAYKQETIKGFLYIWHIPGLKRLFVVSALLNIFSAPILILLPFYVEDYLKLKLDWYGFLLATCSIGAIIGALSAGFITLKGKVRREMMLAFMILNGLVVIVLGLAQSPLMAVVLAFLAGMLGGFNGTNFGTILQISVPSAMRGRVFGCLNTLAGSTVPLGMGLGGVLFDLTGQSIPLVYGGCGGIIAGVSILVAMDREFRHFLAYEPVQHRP